MEFTLEMVSKISKEIAIKIIDLAENEISDDEARGRLIDAVLAMLLSTYVDTRCADLESKQLFMNQLMEYVMSIKETVQ